MSTSSAGAASGHAGRTLFARLLDDAAVFPPGLAPLPEALAEHDRLRASPHADLIGPLLVPVTAARELSHLTHAREQPVRVVLIARPGTPTPQTAEAVALLRQSPTVDLAGVEIAYAPDWTTALGWDLPLAVEVGREPHEQHAALSALADAQDEAVSLVAKLRTQSMAERPVPTAAELAAFVLGCVRRDLPFKLTGGLHHAVAHAAPLPGGGSEEQHGALNVLLATDSALRGGDQVELEELLAERDGSTLAELAASLDQDAVGAVRAALVSYGCCGVLDPIHDLLDLGLLAPAPDTPRGDA